jgi:endogenous inhibitor of DNA gyrase (YacG/DUF329 family)
MKRKTPSDHCPTCKKKFDRSKDTQFLPFCSKRCQMVDLGKWFLEDYSIASNEQPDESELEHQESEDE